MRRADRLFQIVQILRRSSRPVTADALAAELETSKRSVYRDMAALMGQRVPIRGEAGVGYILEDGFDLPPLMLTADEAEAAALGAQWVATHADPVLARAAQDLVAKIAAVAPPDLRAMLTDPLSRAPPAVDAMPVSVDIAVLRAAARTGHKLLLAYRDEAGAATERTVWPVLIGYRELARTLIAWCELRDDFRSFRLDRMMSVKALEARAPTRPAILRRRWLKALTDQARQAG